jgi:tRNA threonylcarbamoyladenosine biosynthesis protein TsaE
MTYESFSPKDTFDIASKIGDTALAGQIYCLNGDLGNGKTLFAKGFAKGLLVQEEITSPTFTLLNEYTSGKYPFYHFDVYRINDISEMEETGYEDYFYSNCICLIEWASLVEEIIPKCAITITIEKNTQISEDYRIITIL